MRKEDNNNNVLRYTSTNGKPVLPTLQGENKIISNTYNNGVGRMVFENPLTEIPSNFMRGSWMLETIIIPSSVKFISNSSFEGCKNLKKIKISEGVLSIGERAFSSTALEKVLIPSSVLLVSYEAFANCKQLVTARFLPSNAGRYIGDYCFRNSTTRNIKIEKNDIFPCTAFQERDI